MQQCWTQWAYEVDAKPSAYISDALAAWQTCVLLSQTRD